MGLTSECSVILTISIWASVPQITHIHSATSLQGLSRYYLLANVVLNSAQLSQTLAYAGFAWPDQHQPLIKEIYNGNVMGTRAFGGCLGLLQIAIQWLSTVWT